jgi:hypothetical protein
MSIAKLMKQKEVIEAQIVQAELVAKNKNRVERLVLKLMHKNSGLFAIELTVLEKYLDEAFAAITSKAKKAEA